MENFHTRHGRPWRTPHEIPLDELFRSAMERLGEQGVTYPDEYCDQLVGKYSAIGVPYPFIVMRIGTARIRDHFFYPEVVRSRGMLLDYGCGTGDAVRHLIADGYPKDRIRGFDVNDRSISIGMDLYRDRESVRDLFIVSGTFPFAGGLFDTIYSGSVFHVIADEGELREYLANAFRSLKGGGVLFGSTMGRVEDKPLPPHRRGPPRLMTREETARHLRSAGFVGVIIRKGKTRRESPEHLTVHEFMARKST
jgi:SAM-dependent methyltransferase